MRRSSLYHRADILLANLLEYLHKHHSSRIRACYLTGSFENNTAVLSSDLDIAVVLREDNNSIFSRQLEVQMGEIASRSNIPLDMVIVDESFFTGNTATNSLDIRYRETVLTVKLASTLVYGEDIREQVALLDIDTYIMQTMHIPYNFMKRCRNGTLHGLPIGYPKEDDEFFGYIDSTGLGSTKLLVTIYGWIASAILAADYKVYVGSKLQCMQSIKERNDDFAEALDIVYRYCRNKWMYKVPVAKHQRDLLRDICQKLLLYENDFLFKYLRFLKDELTSASTERITLAAERLRDWSVTDFNIEKAHTSQ